VRLLWMVWPKYQQVDIWRAGGDEPAATLGTSDTLDGEDVLLGFTENSAGSPVHSWRGRRRSRPQAAPTY